MQLLKSLHCEPRERIIVGSFLFETVGHSFLPALPAPPPEETKGRKEENKTGQYGYPGYVKCQ